MAPKVQTARTFWKTIRSVSIADIAKEAERPANVVVVGDPDRRGEVVGLLLGTSQDHAPIAALPPAYDSTAPEDGFPDTPGDGWLVIDAGGGRASDGAATTLYSVQDLGGWDRVVACILDDHPDLALSLARRYPGFRSSVSDRIIAETALTNAEFAMLNALPGVIPILAALLPVGAVGDIYMLTKNQAMMLYRLAAAHGLPLDLKSRSADLAPLLGNALGWRALARELVAVVPGGVGLVARGAISYAGTAALGRALERYYATGVRPTRAQFVRFYREAYDRARVMLRTRVARIRGRRDPEQPEPLPAEPAPRALPPGDTDADDSREP